MILDAHKNIIREYIDILGINKHKQIYCFLGVGPYERRKLYARFVLPYLCVRTIHKSEFYY